MSSKIVDNLQRQQYISSIVNVAIQFETTHLDLTFNKMEVSETVPCRSAAIYFR